MVIVKARIAGPNIWHRMMRESSRSFGAKNINSIRFNSNDAVSETHVKHESEKSSNYKKNQIHVISLPITTLKSFIYCKHSSDSTKKNLETKLIGLAKKGWDKLIKSEYSINKKIVILVNKLLNTISYDEACLKSFPSKDSIMREVNLDYIKDKSAFEKIKQVIEKKSDYNEKESPNVPTLQNYRIAQRDIIQNQIASNNIKPLSLYHPSLQNEGEILKSLTQFVTEGESRHWKYLSICAVGLPLSLPVAILPVVPNVPGFYLSYRIYCHCKSLIGIKHLKFLLGMDSNETISTQSHLKFEKLSIIDDIYKSTADSTIKSNLNKFDNPDFHSDSNKEELLLSYDIIEKIADRLDLAEIKDDLKIALTQETKRLKKKNQQ